ncbi:MAG TPA: hypothetical protein VME40_15730 [Caulobacteraceae bacterium]|nr:hypothetical protein [Caulobacteraceae bacterium]
MTNVVPASNSEAKVAILLAEQLRHDEGGDYARINVLVARQPQQTLLELQVAALSKLRDAADLEIQRLASEEALLAGTPPPSASG